jgi:Kdo2-lipid IVA lauroyltransferase/acyltransferase
MKSQKKFTWRLLAPKYWGLWLLIGLLKMLVLLPFRWQIAIGKGLGKLVYRVLSSRRRIALRNIERCYPDKSPDDVVQMAKQHFESLGIGLMETAMAWWMSTKRLQKLMHIEGFEHVEQAYAKGAGMLLLGPHNTTMDIVGRYIDTIHPIGVVYREQNNPVIDYLLKSYRDRHHVELIHRHDVRKIVRTLQNNKAVWYPPDQDFGPKHSVFAEFFGIQAATITTPARFARMTGAAMLPVGFYRHDDGSGYTIRAYPALQNFPSDDEVSNARQVNAALEEAIALKPEQYFWLHRRFKTRPAGEAAFY